MIPQAYYYKIKKHLGNNDDKAWAWFKTPSPAFGGLSPLGMMRIGRTEKVKKVIDNMILGNQP